MRRSFSEVGMTRSEIISAIECVKSGTLGEKYVSPSQTTYILCPVDKTLWDFKIVIGLAFENTGFVPSFGTNTRERDVKSLGFVQVKFTRRVKKRCLGVRGCDLSELLDEHTVLWPAGRKESNGFAPQEVHTPNDDGSKKSVLVSRYVRNSKFKQEVLDNAGGICDACKKRIFQNLNGEWFLEVHHKRWLSEDGLDVIENMVALCPNCHRQEHFGKNRLYY